MPVVEIGMSNEIANLTKQRRQDKVSKWIELEEALTGTKGE